MRPGLLLGLDKLRDDSAGMLVGGDDGEQGSNAEADQKASECDVFFDSVEGLPLSGAAGGEYSNKDYSGDKEQKDHPEAKRSGVRRERPVLWAGWK